MSSVSEEDLGLKTLIKEIHVHALAWLSEKIVKMKTG